MSTAFACLVTAWVVAPLGFLAGNWCRGLKCRRCMATQAHPQPQPPNEPRP